jgi:hypothetical protein
MFKKSKKKSDVVTIPKIQETTDNEQDVEAIVESAEVVEKPKPKPKPKVSNEIIRCPRCNFKTRWREQCIYTTPQGNTVNDSCPFCKIIIC